MTNETEAMMNKIGSVWRQFEEVLDEYRPAIGDVDLTTHFELIFNQIKALKQKTLLKPFVFGLMFDGAFNAFHRDVIHDILPYSEKYDSRSWWASQQNLQCRAFLRYFGRLLIPVAFIAKNLDHTSYANGLLTNKELCKDEINAAPNHIKTSALAATVLNLNSGNFRNSPYYQYVAPKKLKFEKYKYLGSNLPHVTNGTSEKDF